jgi:hypothetical protein
MNQYLGVGRKNVEPFKFELCLPCFSLKLEMAQVDLLTGLNIRQQTFRCDLRNVEGFMPFLTPRSSIPLLG